ncbi:hypothetical protein LguiA_022650 [Lonicera macranthoides]
MAKFSLAFLILLQILLNQSMAVRSTVSHPYPRRLMLRIADPPATTESPSYYSSSDGEKELTEAPEIERMEKHHSTDKSVAGGGVIIGGFVTAIFAAVYCYIRVTRQRDGVKQ